MSFGGAITSIGKTIDDVIEVTVSSAGKAGSMTVKMTPETLKGLKSLDDLPKANSIFQGLKVTGVTLKDGTKYVAKVGDGGLKLSPVDKTTVTPAVAKSIDELQASVGPGSKVMDAGKAVAGQVTFTRVAIVTAGVIVAVVLLKDGSGEKIAENLANTTMKLLEPFLPSLLSIFIPICLSLFMAGSAMAMFQML